MSFELTRFKIQSSLLHCSSRSRGHTLVGLLYLRDISDSLIVGAVVTSGTHEPVAGNCLLAAHCSALGCDNVVGCCAGNDVTEVTAPGFDSQRAWKSASSSSVQIHIDWTLKLHVWVYTFLNYWRILMRFARWRFLRFSHQTVHLLKAA